METPRFSYFKNSEVVQFIDNTLSILNKNNPEALMIAPQVQPLNERYQVLNKLYIIDQGNQITEEIQGYDGQRDDCLIGINLFVDAHEKHFKGEMREAYKKLRTMLDKYGRDLYKRSYAEETAGIRSMVNEMESTPDLTAAATTIHLAEWFGELKRVNDLFDKKFLERNEAYAEAPKEKFADVRKETEQAYDEMARHLSAHAIVNASEAHNKAISQLEQLVAGYNQTVKNRIGNSAIGLATE